MNRNSRKIFASFILTAAAVTLFWGSVNVAHAEEIILDVEDVEDVEEEIVELQAIESKCGDDLTYVISNDGKTLTISGNGDMWPDMHWPYGEANYIEKVVINSGVTSVGDNAFFCFERLKSVSIPEGVIRIGDGAFSCTTSFSTVLLPDSLTTIGDEAFMQSGLTEIVIPGNVKHIGSEAFEGSQKLKEITLSVGTEEIGEKAFACLNSLTKITIPGSVKIVEDWMFDSDDNLKSVTICDGVEEIGSSAFNSCRRLTSISLPDSIKRIGKEALTNTGLVEVSLPNGLEKLEELMFWRCESLRKINIPDSLIEIGFAPFNECKSLSVVTGNINGWRSQVTGEEIPTLTADILRDFDAYSNGSLIKIEESQIGKCGDNLIYTIADDGKTLTISGNGDMWPNMKWSFATDQIENIVIDDGVTSVGDYAFSKFQGLKQCPEFPSTITSIGDYAFYNAGNNEMNVSIPGTIKSIGKYAFSWFGIKGLTIEEGVIDIGEYAFANNRNLTEIVLPSTLNNVSDGMFNECTIKKITFNTNAETGSTNIESIGERAFTKDIGMESNVTTVVIIPEGVKSIGDYAFHGDASKNSGVKTLSLPETLEYIGEYAFSENYIESLTVPAGVKYIGNHAFDAGYYGRNPIKTVNISNGSMVLGKEVFNNCKNIEKVNLSGVVELGQRAFWGCSNIKELTLGTQMTTIGQSAFDSEALTEVTIPGNVKDIYEYAFCGCGLTKVNIEAGVERIHREAFRDCHNLSDINIPESVAYIGENAFLDTSVTEDKLEGNWYKLDGSKYSFDNTFREYGATPDLYKETSEEIIKITDGKIHYSISASSDEHSYIGMTVNPSTLGTHDFTEDVVEKTAFTFYADVAADSRYLIDKVTYRVGGGSPIVLIGNKGKYTIPVGKITDNTVIEVTSKPIVFDLSKCTVTAQFITEGKTVDNATVYDKTKAETANGITADEIVIMQGKTKVTNLIEYTDEETPYDYKVSYINNKSAGTAYIVLTANPENEFIEGRVERAFTIKGGNIGDAKSIKITNSPTVTWNGAASGNEVSNLVIYDIKSERNLEENKDFMLIHSGNQKPGSQTVTIIGINGYDGSKDIKYTISKPDLKTLNVGNVSEEFIYSGTKIQPKVQVRHGDILLTEDVDYKVSYKKNTDAGKASMIITGKGNYVGNVTKEFVINSISLDDPEASINVTVENMAYNKGKEVKPNPVVTYEEPSGKIITLKKGKDYSVSYRNNTEISTGESEAEVIITGLNKNYSGSRTVGFRVVSKENEISKAFVFDVKNTEAKAALSKSFTGEAVVLTNDDLAKIIRQKTPEGPSPAGNYKVSYGPNVNAGKVKVTFTGINECYGSKTVDMTIGKRMVETTDDFGVKLNGKDSESFYYSGYAYKPDVVITDKGLNNRELIAGVDYTLSYKNNTNAGSASAVITFKGNYAGNTKETKSITKRFTINSWNLSDDKVEVSVGDAIFLGGKAEVKPGVTLEYDGTVISPKAYKVIYDKTTDKNVGESRLKLEPVKGLKDKNIIAGSTPREITYEIQKGDLADASVNAIKPQAYKGKSIKPLITVKYNKVSLKEGVDYTLSYENSDIKGMAYCKINAIEGSDYKGSLTIPYIIK